MAPGHRKLLLSFQELPPAGVFLLNPGKLYAHHQLNQDFRQYDRQHPMFLLQYVIAYNNNGYVEGTMLQQKGGTETGKDPHDGREGNVTVEGNVVR